MTGRPTRRSRPSRRAIGALSVAALAIVVTAAARRPGTELLGSVFSLVRAQFVDSLSTGEIYQRAARGLVDELDDPYSQLLSPKDLAAFSLSTLGRYGGVGMEVLGVGDSVWVVEVIPGTPSAAAGMRRGDRLLRVAGQSIAGLRVDSVVARLRGEAGTAVRVEVERVGAAEPVVTSLTRAVVQRPAVPFVSVRDGIGYVPLPGVTATAGGEVERALARLAAQGARGAVLDLRGNGGGSVDEAVRAIGGLLPGGSAAVAIHERQGTTIHRTDGSTAARPAATLPLVVLQDGGSASAAEIITGALQDHDRALVVGTSSYGKGLAQTVYPLEGGWALKLTTARWYTPAGRSIHRDRTHGDSVRRGDTRVKEPAVRTARTFGGRPVVDSGGIVPDVWVTGDSTTADERALARRMLGSTRSTDAVNRVAMRIARTVAAAGDTSFVLVPAWRDSLRSALAAAGTTVDDLAWRRGQRYVDRVLEQRVASFAFGRSMAERRALLDDRQYQVADSLLRGAASARALVLDRGGAQKRG
jgi:carboxyl-terminal processing protease